MAHNWTRTGPILPPETIDHIIDYVGPCFPTLRVCGLVARNWLPASRKFVHRDITLNAESIRFTAFINLIKSPFNTFFGTVRAIELVLGHSNGLKPQSLLDQLPQFARLDSIILVAGYIGQPIPLSPTVSTLELSSVQFPSFAAFVDLLSQFPSLKALTLDSLAFPTESRKAKVPHNQKPFSALTDFSANTALQSLRIAHALSISRDGNLGVFPGLPQILQNFKLDRLEELTLGVVFGPFLLGQKPTRELLDQVSAILNRPQYARLKSIQLDVTWKHGLDGLAREVVTTALEKDLPHHAARIILMDCPFGVRHSAVVSFSHIEALGYLMGIDGEI
ncbi:hypothetical protein B0H11DRAFT_1898080 [Mycena galericulata]|nr:hypothetical protein B0H11DRAFT_1898080 [Mycena galericulata]